MEIQGLAPQSNYRLNPPLGSVTALAQDATAAPAPPAR